MCTDEHLANLCKMHSILHFLGKNIHVETPGGLDIFGRPVSQENLRTAQQQAIVAADAADFQAGLWLATGPVDNLPAPLISPLYFFCIIEAILVIYFNLY